MEKVTRIIYNVNTPGLFEASMMEVCETAKAKRRIKELKAQGFVILSVKDCKKAK